MNPRRTILVLLVLAACDLPPRPHRPERPFVSRALPGITAKIRPVDYVSWLVTITNDREDQIRLNWDESSFIGGDGLSRGRLIQGGTLVIDSSRAHPGTPIASKAGYAQLATPEQFLGFRPPARPEMVPPKKGGERPRPRNPAPDAVTVGVGRFVFAFDTKEGREYLELVDYLDGNVPPKPPTTAPETKPEAPPTASGPASSEPK